ncbi:hypothetical protein PT974_00331 [Cladobotryum mycophilum]|uniref:2EXR domain-containing protein n=1 Tax=Cladobotryum mycophilum TaxID=491253 RepID=A0ABR0T0H8_9HYPO
MAPPASASPSDPDMSSSKPHPGFRFFPLLPTELRLQVWRHSLPDVDAPTMAFVREIKVDDGGCAEEKEEVGWDPRKTTLVQVPLPHVFVNYEARQVALQFAAKSGLRMRFRPETRGHIFVRRFSPKRDILYIPFTKGEAFALEYRMRFYFGLSQRNLSMPFALNLAVAGDMLDRHSHMIASATISELIRFNIYVIWDEPPDMNEKEANAPVPPVWTIKTIPRPGNGNSEKGGTPMSVRAFSPNGTGSYVPGDTFFDSGDVHAKALEWQNEVNYAVECIHSGSRDNFTATHTIQPATAVRR